MAAWRSPAQLRLRDDHEAVEGERAVPARQGKDVGGLGARHPAGARFAKGLRKSAASGQEKGDSRESPFRLSAPIGAISSYFIGFSLDGVAASTAGVSLPALFAALVSALRAVRSTSDPLPGWVPFRSPASPVAFRLPDARSALVLALRSSLVVFEPLPGVTEPVASPAGAIAPFLASDLTSARVGDEACANAPCENTATAAATAPKTSLVFIWLLLIVA